MATEKANDLRAFKTFIEERLSNGGADLTLDEALARWEYENQTAEEREVNLPAIREGLEDVNAGRTQPAREALAELRAKHDLNSNALTLQSNPEEWVKRLHELVKSQPIRPNKMDDSRESIYAGRGE